MAYAICLSAGILIEKYSEKFALILAFLLALIGAATFVFLPAFHRPYFFISNWPGMAMLQVVLIIAGVAGRGTFRL